MVLSVHCHDDLGLAVANSLSGVQVGARQVEGCVNGIGERAGNASIEELAMILRTRADALGGLWCGMNTTEITRTSKMVSRMTGYVVQPNKAIVGRNAFAHEAGIHQHGVLSNPLTYEIMDFTSSAWPRARSSSASTRAATPSATPWSRWATSSTRRSSTRPSRASRRWPTARGGSRRPTSRPSSATR